MPFDPELDTARSEYTEGRRAAARAEYVAGLTERSQRIRSLESDVESLRTALLWLAVAVAALAYLAWRDRQGYTE